MPLLDPPSHPELDVPRHRQLEDAEPKRRCALGFPHALYALLAIAAVLIVGVWLLARDAAEPPTTPAGVPVVTATPSAAPVASLPEGAFAGDGAPDDPQVYIVGVHIQPGTYTTAGAIDPQIEGRWTQSRFRTEGDVPRRVTSRSGVGPQTVTLEIGDVMETDGLKPWNPAPEE